MTARNVLVIAMPRSGSNLLIKYIKQLLGLEPRGLELLAFNSGEEYFGLDQHGKEKIGTYDARAVASRMQSDMIKFGRLDRRSKAYLLELYRRYDALKEFGWPTTKVVLDDWRLLPPHMRLEMAEGYDIVITLDRRDLTESTVSLYYAMFQQKWHRDVGEPQFEYSTKERIHPKLLKDYVKRYAEFYELVLQLPKRNAHFEYMQLYDIVRIQHLLSETCALPFNKNPVWPLEKGSNADWRRGHIINYDHLKVLEKQLIGEHNVTFLPRTGIDV